MNENRSFYLFSAICYQIAVVPIKYRINISLSLNCSKGIRAWIYLLKPENVLIINAMQEQPSQGPLASSDTRAGLHIQHWGQIQGSGCALAAGKNTGMKSSCSDHNEKNTNYPHCKYNFNDNLEVQEAIPSSAKKRINTHTHTSKRWDIYHTDHRGRGTIG